MQFAFVFSGQGSQVVGMLSSMADQYPVVKETFCEASDILNYDLWKLVQTGPIKLLSKTYFAQPALLTASISLWRIWRQCTDKVPTLLAGHSLGEYSALVCANVIRFDEAVRLVKLRSKFMQEVAPEGIGAMSAIIGLNDITVNNACIEASKGQVVAIANYNSPRQIVIAGHKDAVERANIICKLAGARHIILLPITIPSHCLLMKDAANKLDYELKKNIFNIPTIPVINNVDVKCETSPILIRKALVRQLYSPVQWTRTVEFMIKRNIKYIYEVGPGRVLTNLIKNINSTLTTLAINDPDTMLRALTQQERD